MQSCLDDFRGQLSTGRTKGGLLRGMIEAKDSETNASFTDAEIIENAVIFIQAGSGTTATALLYLIYEMGIRPEMYARLTEEIRTAFPDKNIFPNVDVAISL